MFGYDAAESGSRRRDSGTSIKTSDAILTDTKRKRLVENARDLPRNFAVASWMIRRHLDYVTSFTFQPQTGNKQLNKQLTELMERQSQPDRCDVSGRHDLQTLMRMAETRRTVDGDVFFIKLESGALQPIEGDRVRNPEGQHAPETPDNCYHGVACDGVLRPLRYAVHSRTDRARYEFHSWKRAENVLALGYYDTFDQVRGISPMSTAINPLKDLYEGFEYALAKQKVSQLFGLAIYREALDEHDGLPDQAEEDDEGEGTDEGERYEVDFGKGPIKLELDPGDKAEFLESKSPATEAQSFWMTMIGIALKSLDIPLSFWDESHTNFYGSRASAMQYDRSCTNKRRDLRALLDKITTWWVVRWVRSGELVLPAGMTIDQIKWEWIHEGTPWWRPLEETKADIEAIKAGFKTHDQVTRQRFGKSFTQIVDAIAEELKYAADKGVRLSTLVTSTSPATDGGKPQEQQDDGDSSATA